MSKDLEIIMLIAALIGEMRANLNVWNKKLVKLYVHRTKLCIIKNNTVKESRKYIILCKYIHDMFSLKNTNYIYYMISLIIYIVF